MIEPMNDLMFLERIFDGYILSLRSRQHFTFHSATDDTQRDLMYFAKLGEMLGYGSTFEHKHPVTRDSMDLSWWTLKMNQSESRLELSDLVLHLERENKQQRNMLTLDRILKGGGDYYRIALLADVPHGTVDNLRKYIDRKIHNKDYKLLVIAWIATSSGGIYRAGYDECEGWVYVGSQSSIRKARVLIDQTGV